MGKEESSYRLMLTLHESFLSNASKDNHQIQFGVVFLGHSVVAKDKYFNLINYIIIASRNKTQ